jgi:hypothetical protein
MAECLPVYGFALAREFAPQLWNSLKLEVRPLACCEVHGLISMQGIPSDRP